eukprot:scaffold310_cov307-Pinguiococcus_pyrenoidosus.AAC.18
MPGQELVRLLRLHFPSGTVPPPAAQAAQPRRNSATKMVGGDHGRVGPKHQSVRCAARFRRFSPRRLDFGSRESPATIQGAALRHTASLGRRIQAASSQRRPGLPQGSYPRAAAEALS